MKITKWQLALAIVATATLGAVGASATSLFDDVDDGRFYSAPAEWAANNGITNGCGGGNFCPDDPVTRGENITFAFRYDDQIVQPALTDINADIDGLETDVDTNAAAIAQLPTIYTISVDDDGTKRRGSDGVTSTQTSTGNDTVDFNGTSITDCIWSATVRFDDAILINGDGMIALNSSWTFAGSFTRVNDVILVDTWTDSDSAADRAFDLTVMC